MSWYYAKQFSDNVCIVNVPVHDLARPGRRGDIHTHTGLCHGVFAKQFHDKSVCNVNAPVHVLTGSSVNPTNTEQARGTPGMILRSVGNAMFVSMLRGS